MPVPVLQPQNYFTLAIKVTDMVSLKGKEELVTDKSKVSVTSKINIRKNLHSLV